MQSVLLELRNHIANYNMSQEEEFHDDKNTVRGIRDAHARRKRNKADRRIERVHDENRVRALSRSTEPSYKAESSSAIRRRKCGQGFSRKTGENTQGTTTLTLRDTTKWKRKDRN